MLRMLDSAELRNSRNYAQTVGRNPHGLERQINDSLTDGEYLTRILELNRFHGPILELSIFYLG